MKRTVDINNRDREMLELLAQGASSKAIAKSLGYREGTMRVYLHELYRKLGVPNKTNAVIWYFDQSRPKVGQAGPLTGSVVSPPMDESLGDLALRTNLFVALGAMNLLLGAYGRVWEVATRLKGGKPDARTEARRRQSRQLWESLLKGDFGYGAKLHESGAGARLLADAPSDAVLLVALLLLGGRTEEADGLIKEFARKKKGVAGITKNEYTLVHSLRDALGTSPGPAMASLYHLAAEATAAPPVRQVAMACLYHAYLAQKDRERARGTAHALWAEAEASRQHLQAMGERPLYRDATLPKPPSMDARRLGSYLEAVATAR